MFKYPIYLLKFPKKLLPETPESLQFPKTLLVFSSQTKLVFGKSPAALSGSLSKANSLFPILNSSNLGESKMWVIGKRTVNFVNPRILN